MKTNFETFVRENNLLQIPVEEAIKRYEANLTEKTVKEDERLYQEFKQKMFDKKESFLKLIATDEYQSMKKFINEIKILESKPIAKYYYFEPIDLPVFTMSFYKKFMSFWAYVLDHDYIPIYSFVEINDEFVFKEFVKYEDFFNNFDRLYYYDSNKNEINQQIEFLKRFKKEY